MRILLALFCYTVFCYVLSFMFGYRMAKLDDHNRVLSNPNVFISLKYTCSELIEYNPDITEVYLGIKSTCYEYEQSIK